MQLKAEQLGAHLEKAANQGLAPLYVVHGDEHLLVIEAADRIRAAARKAGFVERIVLQNERGFRWSTLAEHGQSMSLFGDRKLIDLRIPTGKPGKEGSTALQQYAAMPNPDILTLVTLPRLERDARQSAWFGALEKAGVAIEIFPVERARLPAWIGMRLAAQGQSAAREALEFVADRVEGNLLAAHQEIGKLGLLYPAGKLDEDQVRDAVLNVARFDVFKLNEAMLAGDAGRLARMLDGLKAEGESPVLVHWAITEEIRTLARAQDGQRSGRPLSVLLRELRVWGPRERLYEPALRRLTAKVLRQALQKAAEVDKMAKGLRVKGSSGDVWNELLRLGLMVTA